MDQTKTDGRPAEYAKPTVKDYGTLRELTASGGSKVYDTPIGTPAASVTASTP